MAGSLLEMTHIAGGGDYIWSGKANQVKAQLYLLQRQSGEKVQEMDKSEVGDIQVMDWKGLPMKPLIYV